MTTCHLSQGLVKKQQQNESITLGRRLLSSALGEVALDDIAPERLEQVLQNSKQKSLDELCGAIEQALNPH